MHDLSTIAKINAEAIGKNIPGWRAAGQWVIAEHSGVHFIDAKPYDTEGQARTALVELETHKTPDQSYQLLEPTVVPGDHIVGEVRAIESSEQDGDGTQTTEADANGSRGNPEGGELQNDEQNTVEA